ncbi:WD40-repeat-containing domain protein [Syncephalis fuscata]|nr:WD40-repeat-containing domain protein [Syncephalis fuscata]
MTGIRAFDAEVTSVCFSPTDAHIIYAASGNKVHTFDLRNASMVITESKNILDFSKDEINQIVIDQKGRFMATADDNGDVRVFDIQSQRPYKQMRSVHKNICLGVTFRPKAPYEVISAGLDNQVIVWDITRGSPSTVFDMNTELSASNEVEENKSTTQLVNPPLAHTVATSMDGQLLAAGVGTGDVLVWQSMRNKQWQLRQRYNGHCSAVACVEFAKYTPDVLISGGNDGQLAIWSTKDASPTAPLAKRKAEPFAKINWLTTTNSFDQADIIVSGVAEHAKDDGVVAIYTII